MTGVPTPRTNQGWRKTPQCKPLVRLEGTRSNPLDQKRLARGPSWRLFRRGARPRKPRDHGSNEVDLDDDPRFDAVFRRGLGRRRKCSLGSCRMSGATTFSDKGLEPQLSVSGVLYGLTGHLATPLTFPHAFPFFHGRLLASARHEETSLGASICLSSQVRSK